MKGNGSEIRKKEREKGGKRNDLSAKAIPIPVFHNQHCYTVHQQCKEHVQLAHNSQVF